jgi:hypothetical protein
MKTTIGTPTHFATTALRTELLDIFVRDYGRDKALFHATCMVSTNLEQRALGLMVAQGDFTLWDITSQLALAMGIANVIENVNACRKPMTEYNVRVMVNLYDEAGDKQFLAQAS